MKERARIVIFSRSSGIKIRNISKEAWEERIKHTEAETIRAMNWFNKTFG